MTEDLTKSVQDQKKIKPATWQTLSYSAPVGAFIAVYALLWLTFIDVNGWWEALIAAIAAHLYCRYRFKAEVWVLQQPQMLIYQLPKPAVMQEITDTVPNFHMGDKWWTFHWRNDEKGEIKYICKFEVPVPKQMPLKQQIVLDVYVKPIEENQKTSVRLNYEAEMTHVSYKHCIEMVKATTEAIDFQLKRLEIGKA